MGRRTNSLDILNARVVALDSGRGSGNTAAYTSSSINTSLTATSTLVGLVGPGVVSLAQIYDATGNSVRVRVQIDNTDVLSLSTAGTAGVSSLIGSSLNPNSTGHAMFEEIPFRDSFYVFASKPSGTAPNQTFQVAYRLVEL